MNLIADQQIEESVEAEAGCQPQGPKNQALRFNAKNN